MSVESKIKQLLEGKADDNKQLSEAEKPEELSQISVGDAGRKASAEMKKDNSRSSREANTGDKGVNSIKQGNSEVATVDEFDEDEKNPGAKAAAKVIYAKNPSSIKMKGDAKSMQIPGVTSTSGVSSMTAPASEQVETNDETMLEIDITEELDSIFGEDLSEEFKQKATSIFEAAVVARVNNEMEKIVQKMDEQNATQLDEYKEVMVEKVDSYMNYIVEQWMEENKLAVENGLRNEVTEEFMVGLKTLFKESYIEIPEDKYDVLDDLTNKVESLTAELDETVQDNVNLASKLVEYKKSYAFEEVSGGLAETEKEKLSKLIEGVEFNSDQEFKEKVSVIKENYFPKDKVQSPEQTLVEESGTQEPELDSTNSMSKYIESISRVKK